MHSPSLALHNIQTIQPEQCRNQKIPSRGPIAGREHPVYLHVRQPRPRVPPSASGTLASPPASRICTSKSMRCSASAARASSRITVFQAPTSLALASIECSLCYSLATRLSCGVSTAWDAPSLDSWKSSTSWLSAESSLCPSTRPSTRNRRAVSLSSISWRPSPSSSAASSANEHERAWLLRGLEAHNLGAAPRYRQISALKFSVSFRHYRFVKSPRSSTFIRARLSGYLVLAP